ncbi:MAG: hypothetical protein ACF8AM_17515, partial [Rhodopirellula sp. JB055]
MSVAERRRSASSRRWQQIRTDIASQFRRRVFGSGRAWSFRRRRVASLMIVAFARCWASICKPIASLFQKEVAMETPPGFVPSVDNLAPYQSAVDFFRNKLGPDDTLAFTFTIHSPAQGYLEMIKRTLEEREEYGLTLTITPNLNRPPKTEV